MTHPRTEHRVDEVTTAPREREPLAVSVPQAAIMLGISRALAYELVARGDLPSLRLGRRLVVPRRALVELVETSA
jgi:excisionase family DNA binding protein